MHALILCKKKTSPKALNLAGNRKWEARVHNLVVETGERDICFQRISVMPNDIHRFDVGLIRAESVAQNNDDSAVGATIHLLEDVI